MERRIVWPLCAAVTLATLTGTRVGLAAEQTPAPGTITTVAGTGNLGFSGDGGPAIQARLNWPFGVVVDAAGNVLIADVDNDRVRKVSPEGIITTVAGTGQSGFSGDGGPAAKARLAFPLTLTLDGAGNLFIGDRDNGRVRKVSPDGLISTIAGNGRLGFSGDGGPATEARLGLNAGPAAVDAVGNVYLNDPENNRVRKVSPAGIITTVAGSGPTGVGKGVSAGDGGLATEARLNGPTGVAVDRHGNLFISEWGARVRKVDPQGIITTVAGSDARGFSGDGGPATQARLGTPLGVAVDSAGNLFISEWGTRVRKVDAHGIITTVAGGGTNGYVDGALATATRLDPTGVAVDAAGNLLIADTDRNRILKVFGVAAPGLIAGEPFPSP